MIPLCAHLQYEMAQLGHVHANKVNSQHSVMDLKLGKQSSMYLFARFSRSPILTMHSTNADLQCWRWVLQKCHEACLWHTAQSQYRD